jgi:hypothetical protein
MRRANIGRARQLAIFLRAADAADGMHGGHEFLLLAFTCSKARSSMSVSMAAGDTALMRTPCLAKSSAALRVSPSTACLLAV